MNKPIKQELLMQDRSGQIRINMWGETTGTLTRQPFDWRRPRFLLQTNCSVSSPDQWERQHRNLPPPA